MESKDRRYLRIFQEVSRTIGTTLAVEQRLKILAAGLVKALEVKGCTIRLLDDSGKKLELAASHGLSDQYFQKGPVEADKSIAAALTGRPVAIKDARSDPRIQYPEVVKQEGIVSIASIPIIVRGKVMGVLKLHSDRERDFTLEEIDFATALAEQGGIAVENARLLAKVLEEVQYQKAVSDVTKALGKTLEAKELLNLIVTKAAQILNLKACSLRLVNPKTKRLELACAYGLSEAYLHKGPVDTDRSIASTMTGEVVWIEDATCDNRAQYPEQAKQEGIVSILSVPMTLQDRIIGALRCYTAERRKFNNSQIDFAQSMAEFGALALENARLYSSLKADYQAMMDDVYLFRGYTSGL